MFFSLALGSPALAGLAGEGAAQTAPPVELVTVTAAPGSQLDNAEAFLAARASLDQASAR